MLHRGPPADLVRNAKRVGFAAGCERNGIDGHLREVTGLSRPSANEDCGDEQPRHHVLELSEVARAYGSLIGCAILLISLIGCAILLSCPQRYDSQWIHTIIRNRLVKQRCSNEEEGEEESDFAYGGVCNHIDEDHWRAPRPSRAGQAQYIPVIAPRVTHPGLPSGGAGFGGADPVGVLW